MNEKTAERSIELGYSDGLIKYPHPDGHRVRFSDKVHLHFGYGTQDKLRIIRKALPEKDIKKKKKTLSLLGSCWAAVGHNFKSDILLL